MLNTRFTLLFIFVGSIFTLFSISQINNTPKLPNICIEDFTSLNTICNISMQNTTKPTLNDNQLSLEDYSHLINLSNFKFLKISKCYENPPKLLIVIHSAPSNIINRDLIRETWGKPRLYLKVVFAVGTAGKIMDSQLNEEQEKYNDIVQGNFIDTYKNITYKHVMVLKYAVYHCPKARYILKTDDDVFINTAAAMVMIEEFSQFESNRLLYCDPHYNTSQPLRTDTKWGVSYEEYPSNTYPPYCSGYAVLFSPDTVFLLYNQTQRTKYFWIDDVFVYGIARVHTDIQITPLPTSLLLGRREMFTLLEINNSYPFMKYSFLVGPHNMEIADIRALWDVINQRVIIS